MLSFGTELLWKRFRRLLMTSTNLKRRCARSPLGLFAPQGWWTDGNCHLWACCIWEQVSRWFSCLGLPWFYRLDSMTTSKFLTWTHLQWMHSKWPNPSTNPHSFSSSSPPGIFGGSVSFKSNFPTPCLFWWFLSASKVFQSLSLKSFSSVARWCRPDGLFQLCQLSRCVMDQFGHLLHTRSHCCCFPTSRPYWIYP